MLDWASNADSGSTSKISLHLSFHYLFHLKYIRLATLDFWCQVENLEFHPPAELHFHLGMVIVIVMRKITQHTTAEQ